MNTKRFLKLFLVCFIPLIIAGVITAKNVVADRIEGDIVCRYGNYCTWIDQYDGANQSAMRDRDEWINVMYGHKFSKEKGFLKFLVHALVEPIYLKDVTITHINPVNLGLQPQPESIKILLGENAALMLSRNKTPSFFDKGKLLLTCWDVEINQDTFELSLYCHFESGASTIKVMPQGDSLEFIKSLNTSIISAAAKQKEIFLKEYLIVSSLYLVAFLVISFVAFLIVKACRFVMK